MRCAGWCHCGIFWLLDWQHSHLEDCIHQLIAAIEEAS